MPLPTTMRMRGCSVHSLSEVVPDAPRGSEAELRLTNAYKAVFTGHPGAEDTDLVLTDLANSSGYFRTLGPGRTQDERAFDDGRRWLFARIAAFLYKDGRELMDLQRAASREYAVDYPSTAQAGGLDDYD